MTDTVGTAGDSADSDGTAWRHHEDSVGTGDSVGTARAQGDSVGTVLIVWGQ